MVEIGHYEAEALALITDQVFGGDGDVFEGDVCCGGELACANFDFAAVYAGEVAVDEEE